MDEFDSNDDFDVTDDGCDAGLDDFDAGSDGGLEDFDAGSDGSLEDFSSAGFQDGDDLWEDDGGQMVLSAFTSTPTVNDADTSLTEEENGLTEPEEEALSVDTEADEQLDGQMDMEEYQRIAYAISNTPAMDSASGYWTGYRGQSTFVPTDPEAQAVLEQLGLEGIPYVEGEVVFDDVSACSITLTPEEMELSDAQHKQMLIDAYRDNEDELNQDVLDAFLQEDADTFATELDSDAMHPRFCVHHTEMDEDGNYNLQAVPDIFHNLSHIGGRAESGTQNQRH